MRRRFKGRGALVTVVTAGMIVAGGATACGASDDGGEATVQSGTTPMSIAPTTGAAQSPGEQAAQPTAKRITVLEAADAALQAVPGKIEEIELDDSVWEVDVLAENGKWRELTVHPESGKVLSDRADDDDDHDEAAALRKAKVSASQAATAALKAVPGTVTSVEFDEDDGRGEWEVEITEANGNERELEVDAANGKVTDVDD